MAMLPSENRLRISGWICLTCVALHVLLLATGVLGQTLVVFRALQIALQMLLVVAVMIAYVNLALLLNGPYRYHRANIPIGLVVASTLLGMLQSLFFALYGIFPSLQATAELAFRMSTILTVVSGIASGVLAIALWRLRGVVPFLNRLTEALLFSCLVFVAFPILITRGSYLFLLPLFFVAHAATYSLLAALFFKTAHIARAGWVR